MKDRSPREVELRHTHEVIEVGFQPQPGQHQSVFFHVFITIEWVHQLHWIRFFFFFFQKKDLYFFAAPCRILAPGPGSEPVLPSMKHRILTLDHQGILQNNFFYKEKNLKRIKKLQ